MSVLVSHHLRPEYEVISIGPVIPLTSGTPIFPYQALPPAIRNEVMPDFLILKRVHLFFVLLQLAASSVMASYKTTYYSNPRTMCFVISLAFLAALDSVAGKMLYKLEHSKQLRLWCLLFRFMNMSHSFETNLFCRTLKQ